MSQNLRLKSRHYSGAVQGLIVPQYKLYSIASVRKVLVLGAYLNNV